MLPGAWSDLGEDSLRVNVLASVLTVMQVFILSATSGRQTRCWRLDGCESVRVKTRVDEGL